MGVKNKSQSPSLNPSHQGRDCLQFNVKVIQLYRNFHFIYAGCRCWHRESTLEKGVSKKSPLEKGARGL